MSNQKVAKQLFLNTEAWEEINDIQGEAISGGLTVEDINAKIEAIGEVVSATPNFDPVKTEAIVNNVLLKNGAINKFFS